MKTLELKHLAPYLPYQLQLLNKINDVEVLTAYNIPHALEHWRPLFLPLSEITNDMVDESPYCSKQSFIDDLTGRAAPYAITEWAISKHFDVFGLLDSGLAININTLD